MQEQWVRIDICNSLHQYSGRASPYLIGLKLPLQAGRSSVQISQMTTPKE